MPLASIYANYWEQRDTYPDFETWFESFWDELHSKPVSREALQRFKKYYFDKGIDLRIGEINFQIKKITERKEARQRSTSKRKEVIIPYPVYNLQEYERKAQSPRVSPAARAAYHNALRAFHKYFECLPNGFVVFGERLVEQIVRNADDFEKLRATVEGLQNELRGELSPEG